MAQLVSVQNRKEILNAGAFGVLERNELDNDVRQTKAEQIVDIHESATGTGQKIDSIVVILDPKTDPLNPNPTIRPQAAGIVCALAAIDNYIVPLMNDTTATVVGAVPLIQWVRKAVEMSLRQLGFIKLAKYIPSKISNTLPAGMHQALQEQLDRCFPTTTAAEFWTKEKTEHATHDALSGVIFAHQKFESIRATIPEEVPPEEHQAVDALPLQTPTAQELRQEITAREQSIPNLPTSALAFLNGRDAAYLQNWLHKINLIGQIQGMRTSSGLHPFPTSVMKALRQKSATNLEQVLAEHMKMQSSKVVQGFRFLGNHRKAIGIGGLIIGGFFLVLNISYHYIDSANARRLHNSQQKSLVQPDQTIMETETQPQENSNVTSKKSVRNNNGFQTEATENEKKFQKEIKEGKDFLKQLLESQ